MNNSVRDGGVKLFVFADQIWGPDATWYFRQFNTAKFPGHLNLSQNLKIST